jgi:hypothetical protein
MAMGRKLDKIRKISEKHRKLKRKQELDQMTTTAPSTGDYGIDLEELKKLVEDMKKTQPPMPQPYQPYPPYPYPHQPIGPQSPNSPWDLRPPKQDWYEWTSDTVTTTGEDPNKGKPKISGSSYIFDPNIFTYTYSSSTVPMSSALAKVLVSTA